MKQLNLIAKLPKIVRVICFLEALNKLIAFYPQKLFLQRLKAFLLTHYFAKQMSAIYRK